MQKNCDVVIIGAGAAGLMCGIEAGLRGRDVVVLDKSNKVGKKILMSGGGRCNFTHLHTTPAQYISHNPHFCKSALSRYKPKDFLALVQKHRIKYVEKTPGQLFCEDKASQIVSMLLDECKKSHVNILLNQNIQKITQIANGFCVTTQDITYICQSLVVATGGLSIPTLGSSPFGYQIAEQFGLRVYPTHAGLVPLTLQPQDKMLYEQLTGISMPASVSCKNRTFDDDLLFTHRGLSGPAILQISSYWQPGDELKITLIPAVDLYAELCKIKQSANNSLLKTVLATYVPKRVIEVFFTNSALDLSMQQYSNAKLQEIANTLQNWKIKPNGTEGYRTAEVTLGGVDCNEISSQNFEAKKVPKLFFIGEVLDVSGWLGGYNFQWAWSSGWAAGQYV